MGPPPREGAATFDKFLMEIRSREFRRKPLEEQALVRVAQFKALEAPDAEVPPPERLRLHEVVNALWEDNGPFARACLLQPHVRHRPRIPLRHRIAVLLKLYACQITVLERHR